MLRRSLAGVLAVFLLCGLGAMQRALGATTGTVISVTDIHFDPFQGFGYNVRKKIATSDYEDWRSIYLKSPGPKAPTGRRPTFRSSIQRSARCSPSARTRILFSFPAIFWPMGSKPNIRSTPTPE